MRSALALAALAIVAGACKPDGNPDTLWLNAKPGSSGYGLILSDREPLMF